MSPPRITVVDGVDELNRAGADAVQAAIDEHPRASIVTATGNTPMGTYEELALRRRSGAVDLSQITAVQLDEYLGLQPDDRRTLFGWMRRSFLDPLDVSAARVVRLPLDGDLPRACASFDDALQARGGIDLAILGLGRNGHLGFNEPPSGPDEPTRAVELLPDTIEANAGYWGSVEQVPARAVTMGMRQLLAARRIVVLVAGEGKRTIAHRAIEGPIEAAVPASFLRSSEAEVTVIVDRAAWGDGSP